MKRNRNVKSKWLQYALAAVAGIGLYLVLALVTANMILNETIPESSSGIGLCIAAGVGSFVSGLIASVGEEKRLLCGSLAGVAVAIGVLIAKGVCNQDAHWTLYTSIAVALCVICAMIGSCIFHKRNRKTTKRRKRKT